MASISHPSDGRSPHGGRRTVLYVEDHPVNVLLMEAMLGKRPELELIVATTGEAGYEAALLHRPVLLLLDLRLPDCHGTELLERLRAVPELAGVPAVAVTADDASDPRWAGFIEVWRKPMDVQATLARLDRLLADVGPRDDVAAHRFHDDHGGGEGPGGAGGEGDPGGEEGHHHDAGEPVGGMAAAGAGTAVAAALAWPGTPGHPRAASGPIPFSSLAED